MSASPGCASRPTTVVVGVGAHPDVSLAKKAGLEIGERGGVLADAGSPPPPRTCSRRATSPSTTPSSTRRRLRIEHWDVAENQGKTAARSMMGADEPYDVVPYFFSDLADWTWMEYVGPAYEWDEEIVRGSLDDGEFCHLVPRRRPPRRRAGRQPLRRPRSARAG